jgi:protein ImuB
MDRKACIDIKALPLQLLLRRNPDWAAEPAVVVDKDKPLGLILWANEAARQYRILPGMRYAAGLAIARRLRGGEVQPVEIAEAVRDVTERLWTFSPRIEPSDREPGVFWLDASGLRHLFPNLAAWANQIRAELCDAGLHASAAVGFTRFGCYAAAKAGRGAIVFDTPEQERAHLRDVPMDRLSLEPRFRDILFKLGIETLGAFIKLPPSTIRKRFGAEAEALHQLACGDGWSPLEPVPIFEPVENGLELDWPESDAERLLGVIAGLLHRALAELANRHETLKSIRLMLKLDDRSTLEETVAPATPTLDATQLLALLRLRVEALTLSAGVVELTLRATGVTVTHRQLDLFREAPRQNLDAAERALAQIRAALGEDAVVLARLYEGHLPEARYRWEPFERLVMPTPSFVTARPLIRRLYTPPIELPPRDRHEPDGWLIAGIAEGPVEEVVGPQIVSGGWWMNELTRSYHYVRTRSGRWLWIYHDQNRRRWYLHGEVQ